MNKRSLKICFGAKMFIFSFTKISDYGFTCFRLTNKKYRKLEKKKKKMKRFLINELKFGIKFCINISSFSIAQIYVEVKI